MTDFRYFRISPLVLERVVIDYHQLSLILRLFKFFMIVDDSCFRLTTLMIGHDSFPDSCFGNHRLDSETFRCKWQCSPLAILPPIFTFRFRFSFRSIPFSVLSSTNSLQILHLSYILPTNRLPENKLPPSFVAKMSWVYKFVLRDVI